jgi:single-strand DNA-binding protein
MQDVNKIILIGRLGNDPTRRETKNGTAVVHFSLATSKEVSHLSSNYSAANTENTSLETLDSSLTSSDASLQNSAQTSGRHQETQWHRIVSWGKQAEACAQYLRKGQAVFVEGMVKSRKYEDKEGESKTSFEVHADHVVFLTPKMKNENRHELPLNAIA